MGAGREQALNKVELSRFYSRAGFVIHYFNSSPELRARLAHYVRLYNLGIGQDRAARLAFKRSYDELDSTIALYVRKSLSARVFTTAEGPFMFPPVEIRAGALDQPRVAAALAFVLTRVPVPRGTIDAVVAKNLQYNPTAADANIDQLIFSPKGDSSKALVTLSQRLPGNAQVLAMLGEMILGNAEALRASGLPGWQAQLLQARDQFRLAVKADPGYPATYSGMGRVYLSLPDSEPLEEGMAGFDTASIYVPAPAIFRGLATLALRSHHPDEGLAALRHAVTFADGGGYSEDALLLDNLELLNDVRNGTPTPHA